METLMKTVLISCGKSKQDTSLPVMAKDLYTGVYFKSMLALACTLSSDVKIVSAGYGLLELNSLVLPYNIKMNPQISKKIKGSIVFNNGFISLLPKMYESAIIGEMDRLIPPGLGMGSIMQWAKSQAHGKQSLIDLKSITPGDIKVLI